MTWSNLHEACRHNDKESIIRFATQNDDAFQIEDHKATPLHLLCLNLPDIEALKALVAANPVAVSDRDIHGDTPVHILCRQPEATTELVQVLIDADPHSLAVANKHGYLPLHVACFCAPENEPVIALLVKTNPLALLSHVKIGELATRRPKKTLKNNDTNLHMAEPDTALKKDGVALRMMQNHNFVRDGAYPLHMAVAKGAPLETIELLVTQGREVLEFTNKHGQTPLSVALSTPTVSDSSSSSGGDVSLAVIELLVEACPEALQMADKKGNLPIHRAAAQQEGASYAVLELLLKAWPASASKEDGNGLTACDIAALHGNCTEEVAKLFSSPEYEAFFS